MVARRTEKPIVSVEGYLSLEETSPVKHEYVDGQVHAIAGSTIDHDRIANEIRTLLSIYLGDGPCAVDGPDLRVRAGATVYYYPDALVTCDETLSGRAVEVTAPRLIVEVFSESTAADDRGEKFANYRRIAELEEYLLVDSAQRSVERFQRAGSDHWTYWHYGPDATLSLDSIALTLPVAALYRRTQL